MTNLLQWFSIETTLCTVLGYRLSPLEISSVILSVWGYVEIIRHRIRGLVAGVFATLLMAVLFKQIQLYSDMILMLYYCAATIAAIFVWSRPTPEDSTQHISRISNSSRWNLAAGIAASVIAFRLFSGNLHHLLPVWFAKPAVFIWADALTTSLCIAASILLIRKKTECMLLWLVSNLISIFLYQKQGVLFLAVVYIVYAVMDLAGFIIWNRLASRKNS